MDELFDVLLMEDDSIGGDHERRKMVDQLPIHHGTTSSDGSNHKEDVSSSSLYNKRIDAFYTRDYNMINPGGEKYAGVQGGFLMLRPDEDVFAEYVDLVLQGNYIDGKYTHLQRTTLRPFCLSTQTHFHQLESSYSPTSIL
eukprot:scaffold16142_cov87-Skeletonema_dohrnii-CCMP3373.AAC.1